MKTTALILMIALASQVAAGPHKERTNDLNLTEEQKTQMHAVKQQQFEKLSAAREAIRAESKAAMAEFLTEEQMAKIEQKEQHRQAHKEKGKEHRKMKRKGHRKNKDSE
ncbi:hypothetical protein [Marinicella litoralis]|uniref:Spy/CpxP family protein refolding chaperone n=1 Tax=Marinicella litoralis TaxID=644220 RepID=A0A4R6XV38_9GAMM|nr:hypothetical protein [Marinicella litoralis]TDR23706.1 hypothetical protein C8D91_0570 [Marinicella litoralis]